MAKPKTKIWRAHLKSQEMIDAGFTAEMTGDESWEQIIKPLLLKKGLPEGYLLDQTPCRMSPTADGVMLEFQ